MITNTSSPIMNTERKIDSEAYRELMNYNRELIEETAELKAEIKKLQADLRNAEMLIQAYQATPKDEEHSLKSIMDEGKKIGDDFFDYIDSLQMSKPKPQTELFENSQENPVKKNKPVKRGTQVFIGEKVAADFKHMLSSEGLAFVQVGRAMMLLFMDRSRYRNILLKRVTSRHWESNNSRSTQAFAFSYPEKLGNEFNSMMKDNKVMQFQVFEEMMSEYVNNQWMRKLIKEYIIMVKQRY